MDFAKPVEMSFVLLSVGAIALVIALGIALVYRSKKNMIKRGDN